MGHFLFILMHLGLLLFFAIGLVVTIPLHIIYAAISGSRRGPKAPTPRTHVVCPTCREFVHNEASICPHCRQGLVPRSVAETAYRAAHPGFWGWLNKPR